MKKKYTNLLLPEIQAENKPRDNWIAKRIPAFRKSSLLEIAIFFSFAVLFDQLWGSGNRFWYVNPHPYWIIVILISVQYGIKEGFIAVIVSAFALLFKNMPPKILGQYEFEYIFHVTRLPILWTIAAFIVGGLRQRQIRRYNTIIDEYTKSEARENIIVNKYEELKKVKERIEMRLTGQQTTINDVFETAKALTIFDPEKTIMQSGDLLTKILNPNCYSVFILKDGKLQVQENNWPENAKYKRSFTDDDKLFQEMMMPGKIISVFDESERKILANEGVLCGSFADPDTKQILGIIKIESIEFKHMNREAIARFNIICEWIGYIYAKALAYEKAVCQN